MNGDRSNRTLRLSLLYFLAIDPPRNQSGSFFLAPFPTPRSHRHINTRPASLPLSIAGVSSLSPSPRPPVLSPAAPPSGLGRRPHPRHHPVGRPAEQDLHLEHVHPAVLLDCGVEGG